VDSITIGGLGVNFILQNAQSAQTFSNFIIRGAPDGNPSGVGPIVGIIQTNSNLFKQQVNGFDVSLAWNAIPSGANRLLIKLDGTYLWSFRQQNPDGSYTSAVDRALRAGGGIVPRWQHIATATWINGPWDATFTQRYQKTYKDVLATFDPAGTQPRLVGDYVLYDIQGGWQWKKSTKFSLGVKNIFNTDPPYTNAGGQFAAGFDQTYADVRGRFVYGTVRYSF